MNEFKSKVNHSDISKNNESDLALAKAVSKKFPTNDNILGNQVNIINDIIIIQPPLDKKKNRTLQYYKFLLYSLKTEIKITEFYSLIKHSSIVEIITFMITILLMFSGKLYFPLFVFCGIFHFIKGCIGLYLLEHLPKSYTLIDKMAVNEKLQETDLFNDIVRSVVKEEIFKSLENNRVLLNLYYFLNFVNYVCDLISFYGILIMFKQVQDILNSADFEVKGKYYNVNLLTNNTEANNYTNDIFIENNTNFTNSSGTYYINYFIFDTNTMMHYMTIFIITNIFLSKCMIKVSC